MNPNKYEACQRVTGRDCADPVIVVPSMTNPDYATSIPQFWHNGITYARTGVCFYCDAAMYRRENLGKPGAWTFPQTLSGQVLHAIPGGLVPMAPGKASQPQTK